MNFKKAEVQLLSDISKTTTMTSAAAVAVTKGLAAIHNELRNRKQ